MHTTACRAEPLAVEQSLPRRLDWRSRRTRRGGPFFMRIDYWLDYRFTGREGTKWDILAPVEIHGG
jgi:hypothetical protein